MAEWWQAIAVRAQELPFIRKCLQTLQKPEGGRYSVHSCPAGTLMLWPGEEDGGTLAQELSRRSGDAVLQCTVRDGQLWRCRLWRSGEVLGWDLFRPDPSSGLEDVLHGTGSLSILAMAFDVPVSQIAPYLSPAGSEDSLRQARNFLSALGFPPPPDMTDAARAAVLETGRDGYRFQVNLRGMLDVLSNHLYKSPDVFIRELLQNSADTITQRRKEHPDWTGGRIVIELEERCGMVFRDNGAGLTEAEIHQFLAVIGQSSKTQLSKGQMPEDSIGRFGIGLLSCFMVSDTITIHSRSVSGGAAHSWTGRADGTYTLEPLENCPVGTSVILKAKPGCELWFTHKKVEELVRYYGLVLPVPVMFADRPGRLNSIPESFTDTDRRQLLQFGAWLFGEEFLDAIPIHTRHLDGVAYILSYETASAVKNEHRIYLKQMLLTDQGSTLLPPWAFFLRCFLNTRGLRPTASREDFYEDEALTEARNEFAEAVSAYLIRLSRDDAKLLREIVRTHALTLKSIAVWDDELFRIFIDYLPFETSTGPLTGAELKKMKQAYCVKTVDQFRQLRPVFLAQGKLLICAGYSNDQELLEKIRTVCGTDIISLQDIALDTALDDLEPDDKNCCTALLRIANEGLKEFGCQVEVKRFLPQDLPALIFMSDNVRLLREMQSAREMGNERFSPALAVLLDGAANHPPTMLFLNLNNPLVRRLTVRQDPEVLTSAARILYVQALLSGGYPLQGRELQIMSEELLRLIE